MLDPSQLDRPVAYKTAYSSSRWGSRCLTPEELGISFGLPAQLSLGGLNGSMFPFVPLQVLAGCLDSLGQSDSRVLQPLATTWRLLATFPNSPGCRLSKSVWTILGLITLPSRQRRQKTTEPECRPSYGMNVSFFRSQAYRAGCLFSKLGLCASNGHVYTLNFGLTWPQPMESIGTAN
jgi:hypothetical protein